MDTSVDGNLRIRRLHSFDPAQVTELADLLIDCVEGGASVSFMLPLTRSRAEDFWRSVSDGAVRGDRCVIVAEIIVSESVGRIVGTVQLVWALPENQPHRADLAKMLVRRDARGRGIGAALMDAAERAASDAGKTLRVLDTASDAAQRLYRRSGWTRAGTIPGYALLPGGGPCDTHVFYKALG